MGLFVADELESWLLLLLFRTSQSRVATIVNSATNHIQEMRDRSALNSYAIHFFKDSGRQLQLVQYFKTTKIPKMNPICNSEAHIQMYLKKKSHGTGMQATKVNSQSNRLQWNKLLILFQVSILHGKTKYARSL